MESLDLRKLRLDLGIQAKRQQQCKQKKMGDVLLWVYSNKRNQYE